MHVGCDHDQAVWASQGWSDCDGKHGRPPFKSLFKNRATVADRHWRTSRHWPNGVSGIGSKLA